MARELLLNAFAMNCAGHQSQGMWRHPRDKSENYKHTDHWVELARTLERGKFDGLFLADVVGVYDVYGGSPDTALREAVQEPGGHVGDVSFDEGRDLELKGLAGTHRVYRAEWSESGTGAAAPA